jgi:hypothetical protein
LVAASVAPVQTAQEARLYRRLFEAITKHLVSEKTDIGSFTLMSDSFHPSNMIVKDSKIVAVYD